MKRKIIVGIIILILFVLIGSRIYQNIISKKLGEEVLGAIELPVSVEEVKLGTIEKKLSLTGDIEAQTKVTVYSEVSGKVEKLNVDISDRVRKGDTIAIIEKEKLILQVERLEASFQSAQINLGNLKKDYERIKNLYEQNVVSEQKIDSVKTAYESAQAQVKELKASLELAKIQVADSTISAPIDGVIAQKFIEEGDMITATSQMKGTPIVTIVDMDIVKVMVNITEKDISNIKMGQEARVRVDAYPQKVFEGKVSNISPVLDLLTRTAPIQLEIPNLEYLLKPGMFARIELVLASNKNTVVISKDSILPARRTSSLAGGEEIVQKYVFVVEDNKAKRLEVITGLEEGNNAEILSGLTEGELLITNGHRSVKNGDKIKIVK